MRDYINNCYYCNFYIEDTCECGEWEEEDV